uniref:TOD1/MUCI70 glycosyltransferase-like domain-containing protein n=1 Tax=Kalanchoe fedtschenkoi TaxID=63787 RepID=A0A7N0ZQF5_KALFE
MCGFWGTMNGMSLGIRTTGSCGSLQQQVQNGRLYSQSSFGGNAKKPWKSPATGSTRDKERVLPFICRCMTRKKVGMLVLFVLALLAFISGFATEDKEGAGLKGTPGDPILRHGISMESDIPASISSTTKGSQVRPSSLEERLNVTHNSPYSLLSRRSNGVLTPQNHPCKKFKLPPQPTDRRLGPRPCPVCYVPVEQAVASMPSVPSESPVLHNLNYVREENPIKIGTHGGSDFGGYPSLTLRNMSYDIKESMTVHCGFVRGSKPGRDSGFDISEADLTELEQPHNIIVASAIFGNYDVIQQPQNISKYAKENVPFYMFVDEETEAYLRNTSSLDSSMRIGIWKIILVRNVPYSDSRRNGKIPKLLLHRIFPNIRYSIWIDGKLQLVVDPYQILERFLWRQKATFAISRHYRRFDVFEEAEANKAGGKYDNASIDYQVDFYKNEGLTPYSQAKLPITSDVPEGCVIIKEHIPITNLFTCLWFNEVDRFTSRDQLSFSTVRDKIMSKVNWFINMFLDCERRNFVIQAYHKDLLDNMPPPPVRRPSRPPPLPRVRAAPAKRNPSKRGKGERRSGSRHHRKVEFRWASTEPRQWPEGY